MRATIAGKMTRYVNTEETIVTAWVMLKMFFNVDVFQIYCLFLTKIETIN